MIFVDEIQEDWKDICIYCKQDGEPCNNCVQASNFKEKGKKMKAWTVRGMDSDYATVVFAETAGKAKAIAVGTDACEDYCYLDIRAHRFKEMDKYYRGRREMDWDNDEDRTALVRTGWHCLDPYEWECKACCARELCEWREDNE